VADVPGDSDEEMWSDDPDFEFTLSQHLYKIDEQKRISEAEHISMTGCVVDRRLQALDPKPDIWKLFRIFDDRFFSGMLQRNNVQLNWSKQMTASAGIFYSRSGQWGRKPEIRLSEPLHQLRPRHDLVDSLLHEMIHAYIYVMGEPDTFDGHGSSFHRHKDRVNKEGGCSIDVYHNWHKEVKFQRKHVWKCNGPCKDRAPFYGTCSRPVNRPPGPSDNWYWRHQRTCGGTWIKVAGPTSDSSQSSQSSSQGSSMSSQSSSPDWVPADSYIASMIFLSNLFPGQYDDFFTW
jgi:hypothetical protein